MQVYDSRIGYKDVADVDLELLSNSMSRIVSEFDIDQDQSILIIGCGKGDEARIMQRVTGCKVFAIDPEANEYKGDKLAIIRGDANTLPWEDDSFDFVFCNHVMEHVDKPDRVLKELLRVLKEEGGQYYIAFPNKRRIVPLYLKSHVKITLLEAVKFNLRDLKYKLIGKWENKLGAHAGFSHKEWEHMMRGHNSDYEFDSFPKSFPFYSYFRSRESRFPICLIVPSIKIKKLN